MATFSSSFVPTTCSLGPRHRSSKPELHQKKPTLAVVSARKKDGSEGRHFGGRLVDESMVTLRRRIHEMRTTTTTTTEEIASGGGCGSPEDWTEWERRYYARYGSDVSEMIGMLQVLLLNARPGVGLAAMAALVLSMPAAALVVLFHALAMIR